MYEKVGEPYAGSRLQYQCQTVLDWEQNTAYGKLSKEEQATAWDGKSEWLNVGEPVAFGESTGWIKLPMVKQTFNNAAQSRVDYRIVLEGEEDAEGNPVLFQQINSGVPGSLHWEVWTGHAARRHRPKASADSSRSCAASSTG